jgi:hypothetical protein
MKKKVLITGIAVVAMVLGIILGYMMKKTTSVSPQTTEKKAIKVSKPKPAAPTPASRAPVMPQAPAPTPVVNIYCNCCSSQQVQAQSTPAPRAVSLSPRIPPLPQPAQTTGWWIVISDQTQSYTDDYGLRWVIDSKGDFYCPWPAEDHHPTWTDGHVIWVFNPGHPEKGWYAKWAPGCYR